MEILRRIWIFYANKIKSSESFSKKPAQLIIELNSSLQHIIVTKNFPNYFVRNISRNKNLKITIHILGLLTHIMLPPLSIWEIAVLSKETQKKLKNSTRLL